MIVINDILGDQSYRFRQLALTYGLHLPYFYIKEGVVSESELTALRRRYRLAVLPEMNEADHQAADLLHYRCRKLSVYEARLLVLAKKHKIRYLLHDAALRKVCRAEGVAIIDDHIDTDLTD
ncbi:MAG: hypothetical protein RAP03_14965 [Candidatus Electryonea clarkiae]|nr:hypothetical protein [Candidatus Stygibacter australis]MDP8287969.1 hypothetical protein [Candidatus Electryonea clarkiae]